MQFFIYSAIGLALGHAGDIFFPRLYTDRSLTEPLVRCQECSLPFRGAFALPLVGLAWSKGRCPKCSAFLPARAVVLPIGGAALFALSWATYEDWAGAALAGCFATVFLVLTMTDFDRRLLPNRVVYPSILAAVMLSWAWPESSVVEVIAGGLIGLGLAAVLLLLSLPFGGGAFGMGDVKMIILIGFAVGFPAILVAIFVGTVAAGLAAAFLVITRLRSRKDYMPHGPFLAVGAWVALFWGQEIWDAYRGD
jgi:leader peptidase (prepilin peptidase)/N-methyltransferase